ncbi:hybrid sensor histidine kinase/response regulator [filamentous cyanobacterium CCT1]|nr:hybrid sensor histidine kinase/response regulator [filamentous cyanobacterium CCT1]PSN81081.1 hybrid sensor histidine kinase/response regulator [filamentous cyanobacterium CCP4]
MTPSNELIFLRNGGKTGSLIQEFNWVDTPLGPIEGWSQSLKVALQILLSSRFPMQILWGSDYIQFYNDAYIPIAGNKHPVGIGQRGADCWREVWDFAGPLLDRVMATGVATWSEDQPLVLDRNGQPEEGYFTFSYTPIWDEANRVGGIFIAINETTQKILGERRERTLRAEAQTIAKRLENVLTSISDEFMMFDSNWCFTYVNDRAVAALHTPRQDLLGRSIWEVFPRLVATPFYQRLQGAVEAQTATGFELFDADAGRWLENRVYPFGDGVSLLRVDISDRKHLEQALHASQDQLDSLLNTAPASIARCRFFADRTYVLDYRSQGCEALTGYTLEELTPELWAARTFSEDSAAIADAMFEAVFEQRPITLEYRFLHKDGTVRWIADSLTSRRDEAQTCWIVTMVGIDITARKQAEDDLRRSEAHLALAQRMAQFGSWEFYPNGQQSVWSEAIFEQFGYDPSQTEPSYADLMQRIHPDDRQMVEQFAERAIVDHQPYALDLRVVWADGSQRYLHLRCEPVLDAQGQLVKLMGTCLDITDRKQIEVVLQESQTRLQLALQGANCGTWDYDLTSQDLVWSERCKAIFGIDSTTPMSFEAFARAIHPDDRDRVQRAVDEAIAHRQDYDVEMRTLWPNGTVRWVRSIGRVYRNQWGQPMRMAGVALDISSLKQAEATLRESEERYRMLAEAMPQMVWMADRSGVQYWNQRWYDYTGIPRGTALGTAGTQTVHPDEQERVMVLWQQALEKGEAFEIEQRIRRHDGVYRWFINRGLPVQDSSGEVNRWVGTITDVDDKKQLEDQRARLLEQERVAREAAENANRIKDEFLAVLSHELRSPLNPILGWAKLLRTTQLSAAKTEYALETIERNARQQSQLIDDLLDVSRILRGKLILNSLPTSLTAIIDDALETVCSVSETKGVQIQTELDAAPFKVLGDPNRLKQVVWNLLSNAVKFTPAGGRVSVRLNYVENWAEIHISDTGKGIDPAFLPHVFDRFRQADSTTTRDFGGLGLGLAIAHQIVDMHSGTIHAESLGEGQGANFTVRLPVMLAAVEEPLPIPQLTNGHDLLNIHVMIVEDDVDSRNLITATLQHFGAQVTAFSSAADAIVALAKTQPDILISDIGMPGMDGYMLMQHLREMTSASEIPAIALTSYTTKIDRERIFAAGFQKHLPKPMEVAELIEAILALVPQRSG